LVTPYQVGWVVRLKKKHPCGGTDWDVVRIGADIGLSCVECKRRVLMPRSTLDKRLRAIVSSDERSTKAGPALG
jgi:hypothetical protein